MQEIKKLFFTYRNSAVADTLRRYGIPHKVIFGLQVPQLAAIASELQFDDAASHMETARKLWADREVRESRLLACYLFDHETMTEEEALQLSRDTRTQEEADILAFRLLKRLPYAESLLAALESIDPDDAVSPSTKRVAVSLKNHLV